MPDTGECKVYERIAADGITDGFIRPGGVELTERALSLCSFPLGSRLLDIGCGTGTTLEILIGKHGFHAVGIDPSLPMILQGRTNNPRLSLIRAAGEDLPFFECQWDGVLAECSLSLTRNPDEVLRECRRILKHGGKLILSDMFVRNVEAIPGLRALPMHCCLTGAMSHEELMGKLRSCGFVVLAWEDHSRALKHFAAQLIFAQGSARSFWCSIAGVDSRDALKIEQTVSRAKFGYFLAIAEKSRARELHEM